jgi:hypothetical protein
MVVNVHRFEWFKNAWLKMRCDKRFTHVFTVGSNQGNFFENATACSKRMLKTTVATQLKGTFDLLH